MVSLGPPRDRDDADPGHGDDCACGVCDLLDLFGRKWTLEVLGQLHEAGTVRFNELRREVGGVSPRTLSDRLTELEEAGLVERIDHGTEPPKVEYRLTEMGEGLDGVLEALEGWARKWGVDLDGSRREPVRGPGERD